MPFKFKSLFKKAVSDSSIRYDPPLNNKTEEWYQDLIKKYQLSDIVMEDYVNIFKSINNGDDITVDTFAKFLSVEDLSEVELMMEHITNNNESTISLKIFLLYIIPQCETTNCSIDEIRTMFDDIANNGQLTYRQLMNSVYYSVNDPISETIKSDDFITYDEFEKIILNCGFNKK